MIRVFDPLYGEICLSSPVAELVLCPALQRLREIRLSNIDSVRMPGIANVSYVLLLPAVLLLGLALVPLGVYLSKREIREDLLAQTFDRKAALRRVVKVRSLDEMQL